MTKTFDRETRQALDEIAEVEIETSRGDGAPSHRTIIWIVVDGDNVYVRSVRGAAGRWYRELVANPRGAVHTGVTAVPVQAYPATDAATVARVSEALTHKYQARWPESTAAMLHDEVLPTTLRLEPRSDG
jgi:hypothetical protein